MKKERKLPKPGFCLLSAVVVLAANLVTDIVYAVVNPAIQYD